MFLKMLISLSVLSTIINLTTSQSCTKKRRDKYKYDTRTESYCCAGYVMRNNECVSACVPNCPANSRCTNVNKCTCNYGYTSTTSIPRDIVCEPKCTAGCQPHSTCTKPETCTCDSGYERRRGDGICEPICEERCSEHAICTAPDTCSCVEGYKLNEDLKECVPECQYGCDTTTNTIETGGAAQSLRMTIDGLIFAVFMSAAFV
ncbi:von Willebrand factor D and EGF domain-containing protein [Bactrocera dorsalis]|uniref:von Willebrand factor D and EGF domain-containing protein n=1 Tax=Bactrocera dorsalis TaxID=27457 RepID=A0A6J0RKH7_BACDO|nr:von Willebrand factor D and EGF domain-containing protein [Bactrocera dorsalis]